MNEPCVRKKNTLGTTKKVSCSVIFFLLMFAERTFLSDLHVIYPFFLRYCVCV